MTSPNDSSTGGFLVPDTAAVAAPLEDNALADFLQAWVVGLTGLPAALVWPRWQPNPPNMPTNATNWASIGIREVEGDTFAFENHAPALNSGAGENLIQRTETLEVLCSFYGPNANGNASLLRDGASVAQNSEVFQLNGMGLVSVGGIHAVPSLINNQWYYRNDVTVKIRRSIIRAYPVLHLLTAQGSVKTDTGLTTPFHTT